MTTSAVQNMIEASMEEIEPIIKENKKLGYKNFSKVMAAFLDNEVTDTDFSGTTGYGYNDIGRDKLEDIYRDVFRAGDALVRSQIISGTHAISLVLLSLLKKGDELLYITGTPYDTLEKVIGSSEADIGSLYDEGVYYNEVDLKDDTFDTDAILNAVTDKTLSLIHI